MRRLTCALALAIAACGGNGGAPHVPDGDDESGDGSDREHSERVPSTSAEIGALDEDAVKKGFSDVMDTLMKCRDRGSKKIEFLGGSVRIFMKVDSSGKVVHAHFEETTLGDRETEKCMLDALAARSWPKPVGGQVGIAKTGFTFDPNDVRQPTEWSSDRATEVQGALAGKIRECGGASGFTATVYVDTDGTALGAGVAPADEGGEERVDCVVDALLAAKYPPSGSWPAKVTFGL